MIKEEVSGKSAYMKRTATRQSKKLYYKKKLNYTPDKESENLAYEIALKKLLKDISKK